MNIGSSSWPFSYFFCLCPVRSVCFLRRTGTLGHPISLLSFVGDLTSRVAPCSGKSVKQEATLNSPLIYKNPFLEESRSSKMILKSTKTFKEKAHNDLLKDHKRKANCLLTGSCISGNAHVRFHEKSDKRVEDLVEEDKVDQAKGRQKGIYIKDQ
ncbi:hypothetical protein GQ457_02G027780 [Hibiscus cannabinus]